MPEESLLEKREENVSFWVFSVSATMVGVCFTVLGLLTVLKASIPRAQTLIEEYITFTALIFLSSCLVSYIGIRTRDRKRRFWLEKVSDAVFISGLLLMVLGCVLFALEIL